jgi:hypothetical protein
MWNQVNYTQNYYANIGTSAPYNQWLYPLVSCPHQELSTTTFHDDESVVCILQNEEITGVVQC